MRLTREAFAALIAEDRAWLIANAPDSLERQHIIDVLDSAVVAHYGQPRVGAGGEG